KIFMPILFILMAIVVFWSVRLPGAGEGISIYLTPDFERLKSPRVWLDAFGQIFFSLSLGFGIMTAYASYLPPKSQITRDSFIIGLVNCIFSVFAGFGVFAVLGYMAHTTGQPFSEIVAESIGLAFIVYPKVISMMPHFGNLFGVLFFGALVIAGLSSAVSIVEAFTSAGIDKFHHKRGSLVSTLCVTGFLGSIIFCMQGSFLWIDIVDHFIMQYGLIIAGFFECILIGWVYGAEKLRMHINKHSVAKTYRIWDFFICWVIPLFLGLSIVQGLITELKAPYGGYSWLAIVLIGRDWLLYTLFAGIIVAGHEWRSDPRERMLE
ncbi:MAG: sodium-dependent transporter, partial [Candidatus Omnitrophica bacterium]|nr:sodium-dependent transporter [Candidatus Omnitrophota bacterium]